MLRSLATSGRRLALQPQQLQQQQRSFAVFRLCEPFNFRDDTDPSPLNPDAGEQYWSRDQVENELVRAEARHRRMISENGLDVRRGKDDRNVKPTDQRRITKSDYIYGDEKRKRLTVLNFCLAQRMREKELLPAAAGVTHQHELEQLEKDKAYVMRAIKEELKRSKKRTGK